MAKKIQETLVDDLNGEPADSTITIGLDGRFVEVDLTKANEKELREMLKPYMRKGRTVAPPKPESEARLVRAWALEQGMEVNPRGRLHRDVIAAYREANK